MDFLKVPTIIGIVILTIHSVSSSDCLSPTGKVTCECTATSIECTGNSSTVPDIEDVLRLANFSEMQTVIVQMDDLKFGPPFAFGNTSIRYLTLGYGLQTLPSYFFEGSSLLISLNLEKNKIQYIDDQLFSSLSALEELILDGNDLSNLNSSMFMNLPKLKLLSIAGNNLREIDEDVFQHLSALEILTLSHNKISSIGNLRMTSTSVVELNAANCSIKGALENDSFSGLPNLQRLDLSHNEIFEVKPHALSTLRNLEYLDLSYNSIHRLEDKAFFEMENLTTLNLKHNGISVLRQTCFENLKKLVILDLSFNSMTAVLCEYTIHFDSLEEIYLQNNRIKMFTQGAFYYSPHLKVLNITDNNLECSCSLTDSALYLIQNSTITKEELDSIPCVRPSNPPTIDNITGFKSSACSTPLEQCKRPDDTQKGSSDDYEDDYDASSFPPTAESTAASSTASTTQSTKDTAATSIPPTEPVTVESTSLILSTSTIKTASNILTTTLSTTENTADDTQKGSSEDYNDDYDASSVPPAAESTAASSTASTTQSTNDTAATSIPPAEPVTVENTTLILSTSTIKTTSNILTTTLSTTEYTMPINGSLHSTTNDTLMATESATGSTTQSTPNITEPVTGENRSELIPSTSTIKTTSRVLTTDVSSKTTTAIGITSSTTDAKDRCSSLDLSVGILPSDSKFMVFRNFSYDGSTFCLKWTIVGDLKDIKKCVVSYTFKNGKKLKRKPCPEVNNEIMTWWSDEEIYKICLVISAAKELSFCNDTLYGRTPVAVTATTPLIYISQTTPFKATEAVGLTEDSTDNHPQFPSTTIQISRDYFTISISVYTNNSNLAFAVWTVSAEAPRNVCNITLTSSTANDHFDYKEGIFPCKNNSYRLRNVKETDIFKVCIVHHHEKYGQAKECALSVSPPLESKSEKEDSYNSAFIPLMCLLILLIIIVAIIIFKNMKKQESKKYNVRDEENKYDQRVKVRPQSTSDQSIRFSYLARENYDHA